MIRRILAALGLVKKPPPATIVKSETKPHDQP